ncbi:MAG: GNAT family N-acetyltransferase [Fimbriimonadaceae bacterium]|nr:GNAT family N-acetyltransferase [Fimbriimonadaceae bacterium]
MTVRPLLQADIPLVVTLQRACFPPPFPEELLWKRAHLERHLELFPAGQLVAVIGERVVGSATNMLMGEEQWMSRNDWETMTGGHMLSAHDPEGTTLFGVDISVSPEFRRQGMGRKLYEARFSLVQSLSLKRYGTATRIPDFASSGCPTIPAYLGEVARGDRTDRTVTPILRMGCMITGFVEEFMEDKESGNGAAILEWRPT